MIYLIHLYEPQITHGIGTHHKMVFLPVSNCRSRTCVVADQAVQSLARTSMLPQPHFQAIHRKTSLNYVLAIQENCTVDLKSLNENLIFDYISVKALITLEQFSLINIVTVKMR